MQPMAQYMMFCHRERMLEAEREVVQDVHQ